MQTIYLILASFALAYFFRKVLSVWKALRSIDYLAGYRHLFSQYSLVAMLFPPIPIVSPGSNHLFHDKHTPFAAFGWDIMSIIFAFPETTTVLVVADPEVIKEITSSRARFPKPIDMYQILQFYGDNIVASEGIDWKKTRKISAPAFSERNVKLVWDETIRVLNSLYDEIWQNKDVVTIDNCVDMTLPITLHVIAVAGFGRKIFWGDNEEISASHRMSFKEALHIMCTEVFFKVALPDRMLELTQRTLKVKIAFEELRAHMLEMIKERQYSEKAGRHDLFSNLLLANVNELDFASLTDDELISNIYIFLLAGHETTAHTLAFAFGLLALFPDEQEKLYQHIKSVSSDGKLPPYEECSKLTYSMAVLYETLRLFPAVVNIPKLSAEDTTFTTQNAEGERLVVPVPKGTKLAIDVPALHYNPQYWRNPYKFDPSRFLEDWPRDAFIPFATGARACLGRKFAETEAIAVLTMMVLQYKITIKDEPQFQGETFEQRKERVFQTRNAMTLTPLRVPLTFTRRQ